MLLSFNALSRFEDMLNRHYHGRRFQVFHAIYLDLYFEIRRKNYFRLFFQVVYVRDYWLDDGHPVVIQILTLCGTAKKHGVAHFFPPGKNFRTSNL